MLKIVQLYNIENKAAVFLLAEVPIWRVALHLLLLQMLWVGWWKFKPKSCLRGFAHMPFMRGEMYFLGYIFLLIRYLFFMWSCVTS